MTVSEFYFYSSWKTSEAFKCPPLWTCIGHKELSHMTSAVVNIAAVLFL